MTRLRRIVRDVGAGIAVVVVVSSVRRVIALRRLDQGLPIRSTRRVRQLDRERQRAAARWLVDNAAPLRALLTDSEKASVQLSIWDNARRTSEAYLDSATVVEDSLSGASSSGADKRALQDKIADLRGDAQPHLTTAETAMAELEKIQPHLSEQGRSMRRGAPSADADTIRRLVAEHDSARRPPPGRLDELASRRRLDEIAALREALERRLEGMSRAG